MQKQVHFKCTLHLESPEPGRYRQIAVVEQADHFELRVFEGALLTVNQNDRESAQRHSTLDAARAAADEEIRKSLADGWSRVL